MNYVKWWMVVIIVLRDVLVTIMRVYAIQRGRPIVTSQIAKWKTFSQMTIILVILIFLNVLNYYGSGSASYHAKYFDFIGIFMLAITLLTLVSAYFYIKENWQLIWQMLKEVFTFSSR
jgi:CDP-diacylglycerol--glycerol-3-phosphate 3-phosphatidyltransferase